LRKKNLAGKKKKRNKRVYQDCARCNAATPTFIEANVPEEERAELLSFHLALEAQEKEMAAKAKEDAAKADEATGDGAGARAKEGEASQETACDDTAKE
jgi:hypothetical protein